MNDDIILNKASNIEKCLNRINEEYIGKEDLFRTNSTIQDSVVLNLQRACESSIDLANYLIRKYKLGVPQTSRDAFDSIQKAGIISSELAFKMKKMVGFRNVAVHEYHVLNLSVIESIIRNDLPDFRSFISDILHYKK
jgi:uncharacterized protein YutE (UPF0331/DUF86 family)